MAKRALKLSWPEALLRLPVLGFGVQRFRVLGFRVSSFREQVLGCRGLGFRT